MMTRLVVEQERHADEEPQQLVVHLGDVVAAAVPRPAAQVRQ